MRQLSNSSFPFAVVTAPPADSAVHDMSFERMEVGTAMRSAARIWKPHISGSAFTVKGWGKMRQNAKNVSPLSNEARTAFTIEHITDALLKLLKDVPFSEITVSEICSHASVGRASFYRNFESKEDVLKKWLDKVTDDFVSDSAISFEKDSSKEYYSKLFTHMMQYKEICLILYKAGGVLLIQFL